MIPNPDDPTKLKPFKYETPASQKPKTIAWLARTPWMTAAIQKVNNGGETNLHSHSHMDGFWFVLSGRARFYSDHKDVAAELGPHEGILIPRGVKYWFESASSEPLEILQVECSDVEIKSREELMADRTNYAPQSRVVGSSEHVDAKVLT